MLILWSLLKFINRLVSFCSSFQNPKIVQALKLIKRRRNLWKIIDLGMCIFLGNACTGCPRFFEN